MLDRYILHSHCKVMRLYCLQPSELKASSHAAVYKPVMYVPRSYLLCTCSLYSCKDYMYTVLPWPYSKYRVKFTPDTGE